MEPRKFGPDGYDKDGYDKDGFDRNNMTSDGFSRERLEQIYKLPPDLQGQAVDLHFAERKIKQANRS